MRKVHVLLVILFIFLATSPLHSKENEYMVKKVIDGDTIQLENGEIVRYLGIDAPEIKKSGSDFFARESLRQNRRLVDKKKVRLEFDVEKRDQYGRLLAYVFVKKLFVNSELVKLGYAKANVRPPNLKYKDIIIANQQAAMKQERGLWQEKKKDTEKNYVGNKRTNSLHRPNCKILDKIPEKNRIIFNNRADALKIGYIPCKICKP